MMENKKQEIEKETIQKKVEESKETERKITNEIGLKEPVKERKKETVENVKQNKSEEGGETKSKIDTQTKQKSKEKLKQSSGPRKTEAVVNAKDLGISTKQAIALCNFIRKKDIDQAIFELELVKKMKKPVPMKGEIPHKKGIMSGRYPVKAAEVFIKILKSLKSNALLNELELEKVRIFCKANVASRPYRRGGRTRFKRTHLQVKLIQYPEKKKKGKK